MSERDRFMTKFVIDDKTGCWNWALSKNNKGYGQFSPHSRNPQISTIEMKLKPWTTPDYVHIDMPARPKQEGMHELPAIHITELLGKELDGLVQQWLNDLYVKAGKPCNWINTPAAGG